MKTIEYHQFGEQLFVEKLANGLTVYLQPKRGFHKTIATLGVNYGSVDSQFNLAGKLISQPAGIAHFLEHKMFDKKDYDVFELFNQTGASANAYTSFTNTNYLFSTAGNLKKNLMILLDFVQIPYFTEEKVTREKGIIDQEINMYRNDAGNRIYFQTVADLYPIHRWHWILLDPLTRFLKSRLRMFKPPTRRFIDLRTWHFLLLETLIPSKR